MGIKNFKTYGEVLFGAACFKEFSVNNAKLEIDDFFNRRLLEPAHRRLRDDGTDSSTETAAAVALDRCGVYIDLASYMYGTMLKSLEQTDQFERITASLSEEKTDDFVVVDLEEETVKQIVDDCSRTLMSRLRLLLLKSYRIYLAYDTVPPSTKAFEQNARRRKLKFSLSAKSKDACFGKLASMVKALVVRDHRAYLALSFVLDEELDCDSDAEAVDPNSRWVRDIVDEATRDLFGNPFAVGEGEWKCFYHMWDDIAAGLIDRCYVFGRDWDIVLAMTLYQHPTNAGAIRYVHGEKESFEHVELFDDKKRALHFIGLCLFGNDYVGGLVNLSPKNAEVLKREFDRIYDDSATIYTARQLRILADTLFSRRELTVEEEQEVDPVKRSSLCRAFATVVARLLTAVYGKKENGDAVEEVLHHADLKNVEYPPEYLIRSRRINEEKQRGESLATTDNGATMGNGGETPLDQKSERQAKDTVTAVKRKCEDDENRSCVVGVKKIKADDDPADENTTLSCRDRRGHIVLRTVQQCLDSFARGMLWYLSYTLFYLKSPSARQMIRAAKTRGDVAEQGLLVGLYTGRDRAFRYDDVRPEGRHDLCRLLDLRRAIRRMTTCDMFWIIEYAFENALNQ